MVLAFLVQYVVNSDFGAWTKVIPTNCPQTRQNGQNRVQIRWTDVRTSDIAVLRRQNLGVPVAVPPRGHDRDVLSPKRPHEPLALHGALYQPGVPRVEPMQFRDGPDPGRLELAANAFRDAGQLVERHVGDAIRHVARG